MTLQPDAEFQYEGRTYWGTESVSAAKTPSGRKLEACLAALQDVHGRVLEVGCGTGRFIRAIKRARPDLQVYGSDIASSVIARARIEDAGQMVSYVESDARSLPFPDGYFDAVIMIDVLEHIPQPLDVLRESARVLHPGGVYFLYVPLEGNPRTLYRLHRKSRIVPDLTFRAVGHIHHFSTSDILELATSAGLHIDWTRHTHFPLGQLVGLGTYSYLAAFGERGLEVARPSASPDSYPHFIRQSVASARTVLGRLLYMEEDTPLHARFAGALYLKSRKPTSLSKE